MPRPPKKIRPVQMNLSLDEDVVARMQLELYSEVEQRIPHGAQSKFINTVLRKHFRSEDARRKELARRAKLAEGVPEAIDAALAEGAKLDELPL